MMKFIMMIFFIQFICFKKKFFWMAQMMMMWIMLLFMNSFISLINFSKISYMFSLDIMSFGFILLTIWISILMIMSSENLYKNDYYYNFFMLNIMVLLIILFITFSVMNLFMFYLFFESSLIPMMILIIGWGYQPERLQSGIYLLFYTLFLSLPLLLSIFFIMKLTNFNMIYFMKYLNYDLWIIYFSMILAFLVKMPMFMLHLWLPKAHVEASVSGSMILAGIMLKLGGYGLLRIMIILQKLNLKLNYFLISISLVGGLYISLLCFCQIDMKSLIAYSSVAHMSLVISGILTMNYWGFLGSYVLMIGHGLCSSGMFCLVNINYERLLSRSIYINKGMMVFMPTMSMWWFLLMSSNMASPPSMNLLGEVSLINSLVSWSWLTMIFLMMISFFSAGYSLYLYSFIQHGKFYLGTYSFYMGVSREYLLLMLHWLPLNFMIMKIDFLMIWL